MNKSLLAIGSAFVLLLVHGSALAQNQTLTFARSDPNTRAPSTDPNAVFGTATITSVDNGPDLMVAQFSGLDPNTRFTLFQTFLNTTGSMPLVFLSEFTTDGAGSAAVTLLTEIINQRASFNLNVSDAIDGTQGAPGAFTCPGKDFSAFGVPGVLPLSGVVQTGNINATDGTSPLCGGISFRLPHFRVYRADVGPVRTVFGPTAADSSFGTDPNNVSRSDGGGIIGATLTGISLNP